MTEITARKLGHAAFLSLAIVFSPPAATQAQTAVRYEAQPAGSKVRLEGTSTIHDWTVESPLIGGFMEVDPGFPESAVNNPKAARPVVQAFIVVRTLKSHARKMDEVMQEHLNMTRFPRIEYRVIELKPTSAPGAAGPLQFDAVGTLTVSGTSRTNTMPVTIQRIDKTQIKVTGSTPLKMTDFGVTPPAPSILGMPVIKTGDEIKISFEWMTAQKIEAL